jgi:N-acetylglucosaminyldiphosphoundecaprenol N-acetyl-beta-D-mannosaminyltransferase
MRGMAWSLVVRTSAVAKRSLDIGVASILLLLLSPCLLAIGLVLWRRGDGLQRTPRVGRWCEPFLELSFPAPTGRLMRFIWHLGLGRLPVLWNIVRGDLSLIGPRAVAPGELSPRQRLVRRRYNVRPGLIGVWWIKKRANIAYEHEGEVDSMYAETQTLSSDLGIALGAIPAILYGAARHTAPDSITVLGIPVANMTMSEALDTIMAHLDDSGPSQVCFVNPHGVNIAWQNPAYRRVLCQAPLTLADGIGMKLAGRLLAQDFKQNVNGTDLFPRLCQRLSGAPGGMYLLGGRPGVAERVREWITVQYPGVHVCGCHDGYFSTAQEPEVLRDIVQSGAHLLLVALGVPRQDLWVARHLEATGVRVAMGVGGLFDFYAGRIPRAPPWLRDMGLEWLYRLYQEPGRMWRRYLLGNALFLYRVLRARWRPARPAPKVRVSR